MENHQPVIRVRSEHCISRRDIDPDALKVLYRLARRNHIAYLVGGGVRDLLLQRAPKDFDVSTSAHPRQIKTLFRNCFLIGRRFRLAHIKYGEKVIETSTFRKMPSQDADPNDPDASLFQHDDNNFGTPEEDAMRRDFTINGLFYDIESFSVIDYVGGLDDLEKRMVRSIGDPNIRFREDPVRMIRAIRFASRLGFSIEPVTLEAIATHREEILKASPPRLLEEVYRLFGFSSAEAAFKLLYDTGMMEIMFPALYIRIAEDETKREALWQHLSCLDSGNLISEEVTPSLMLGSLAFGTFVDKLYGPQDDKNRISIPGQARAAIGEVFSLIQAPKRVVDQLMRSFVAQQRIANRPKRRFSKSKFASQPIFPEALCFHEMFVGSTGKGEDELQHWKSLYAELPNDSAEDPEKNSARKSGRRRRSGRSKKTVSERICPPAPTRLTAEDPAACAAPLTSDSQKNTKKSKSRSRRRPAKPSHKSDQDDQSPKIDIDKPISPADVYQKTSADRPMQAKPKEDKKPREVSSIKQDTQAPHWMDEI